MCDLLWSDPDAQGGLGKILYIIWKFMKNLVKFGKILRNIHCFTENSFNFHGKVFN